MRQELLDSTGTRPQYACLMGWLLLLPTIWRAAVALDVEASVEAAWPTAPLAAELLEGLAEVDLGLPYLRELSEAAASRPSASTWTQLAAETAEKNLCCGGSSLFARFLSLQVRYASASMRVEASRGLERSDHIAFIGKGEAGNCRLGLPWMVLALPGQQSVKTICGSKALKDFGAEVRSGVFTFSGDSVEADTRLPSRVLDHVFYSSEPLHPQAVKVIAYADLGSAEASAASLQTLLSIVEVMKRKQLLGYAAFRHGTPDSEAAAPAVLAGYGVALFAKSADEVAKSKDVEAENSRSGQVGQDSNQDGQGSCTWQGAHTKSSAKDPAEHFYGLDLDAIAGRHPAVKPALCSLRGDLQASAGDALPPWELKYLGAYAAARATRTANASGGFAGLVALEESAQDFPSGWAHALAAESVGNEAGARDMMTYSEEHLQETGLLEVNGWRVPKTHRGLLQMLRAHAPLLQAVETLGRQGFQEGQAAELLRDSRPPPPLSERYVTGDPRLSPQARDTDGPMVLFNVRQDVDAEKVRKFDTQENAKMGIPSSYADQGPLIRLVRLFDRFWNWPPPVSRPLVGIGLTLDPCDAEHLAVIDGILDHDMKAPIVLWLSLKTLNPLHQKLGALIRAAADTLGKETAAKSRSFLSLWRQTAAKGSSELCGAGAEGRLQKTWKRNWPGTAPELKPLDINKEGRDASMPVPSATINGQIVHGSSLLNEINNLCLQEVRRLVNALHSEELDMSSTDEVIAKWQYEIGSTSQDAPTITQAYHPVIKPGARRYVPIAPEVLSRLPGGYINALPITPLSLHVLMLPDPAVSQQKKASIQEAGEFLKVYADRVSLAPEWRRWWLGIAIAGKCSPGSPLGIAGAMRRCLMAAVPPTPVDTKQKRSKDFAEKLLVVASAWQRTSDAVEAADGDDKATAAILEACATASKSTGPSDVLDKLKPTNLHFDEDDLRHCSAQQAVVDSFGPATGAAMISVNGRLYGPISYDQDGVRLTAAHLAYAEDVEHYYGHQVRGHTAKKLSWRQAPGDESKKWPGAGVSMAIRRMGASDDPFRLAYGFAVRARAIEEALSVRGEEREDGVPTGRHIEEGSDEEGKSPLEISFEKAPESLKLHVPCMPSLPCPFRIFTVLDPLSEEAQRSPAVLKVLHEELNAEINIILAPRPLVASPLVQYYRVAQAAAAPPGGLGALGQWNSTLHGVRFSLPRRPGLLLSTLLHTPDAWMCSAVDSGEADLDSLRADKDGVVRARYALEAMFIEGWALNVSIRSEGYPAAGKHLALVPAGNMEKQEGMAGSGSVVVKSGYFQLRVPPGIYDLVSQGNDAGRIIFPKGQIALTELAGRGSSLRVHVASHHASTPSESVASSSASHVTTTSADYEGAGGDRSKCNETIHVFSVASGHRYERLLRIMMLSVRKHTDCPLHFWLIENFLSPHFRRLLPALAAKVGFAVSRVTYKWPAWVRTQTEKQRVIWAYKILFLDVLFPLQVQRILFIDADQIVRANVKELWDIDLKGRVYGFVPFCGSGPKEGWFGTGNTGDAKNPDTLGHRFWEQGFWNDHLGSNLYYHISALFVVDLALFRRVGAGDILRDVYQSLTQDPHSLANLDQDLPNYVQRGRGSALEIFSLPQDWLWCETWCNEQAKPRAKTIDMCQNPVRKEGKLEQARRIAPEWIEYDKHLTSIIEETSTSPQHS